jgi:hypothetical protein
MSVVYTGAQTRHVSIEIGNKKFEVESICEVSGRTAYNTCNIVLWKKPKVHSSIVPFIRCPWTFSSLILTTTLQMRATGRRSYLPLACLRKLGIIRYRINRLNSTHMVPTWLSIVRVPVQVFIFVKRGSEKVKIQPRNGCPGRSEKSFLDRTIKPGDAQSLTEINSGYCVADDIGTDASQVEVGRVLPL